MSRGQQDQVVERAMIGASLWRRVLERRTLAGTAAAFAVAASTLVLIGAGRSGAMPAGPRLAAIGEARSETVTLALAPATSDQVLGGPNSAGRPIVVIDPGHGGRDPGAISVSAQVREKELTLALGSDLRDALVRRGRVRVAMTRTDDRYLTLEERADVARRLQASLFVSLHMDSAPNPLARGASVYSLSDIASDAEAARFAQMENAHAATDSDDGSARSLLADLAMRGQMRDSADLAERLVRKSAGRVGLRPEPHRFAAFHVLRRAETPAILFEAGYLSNADDELLLRSPEHRAAIVLALAQAIEADVASRSRR